MDRRAGNRERNRRTVEELAIGPGDTLLEIGCGPGQGIAAALAAGARHVVALDHAPEMLRQAATTHAVAIRAGRLTLRLGDIWSLAEGDGPFDAVMLVNVAMFLDNRPEWFDRIREGMTENGRIAICQEPRMNSTAAKAEALYAQLEQELSLARFRRIERRRWRWERTTVTCLMARKHI